MADHLGWQPWDMSGLTLKEFKDGVEYVRRKQTLTAQGLRVV